MERFPAGLRRPLYALGKCKNNLKSWLSHTWLDLISLLLILPAMGALYTWSPVYRYESLIFPMRKDPYSGKWHAPMEISWPARPFIVSILVLTTIAPLVGAGVIIGMYLWAICTPSRKLLDVYQLEAARRDPWNMGAALSGLFQGFAIVTLIQVIFKSFVGRAISNFRPKVHKLIHTGELRPYFMSLCNPKNIDFTPSGTNPSIRFPQITQCPAWNASCTSRSFLHQSRQCRDWNFAVQSFPSGHTIEAFFVGVYLALCLNAKLNAFSGYSTSLWKMLVILSPVLGAVLVAMSVAMDHHHHTHDVVWSIPIGVVTALIAYRAHFASLWDYRCNHLRVRWRGFEEGGF